VRYGGPAVAQTVAGDHRDDAAGEVCAIELPLAGVWPGIGEHYNECSRAADQNSLAHGLVDNTWLLVINKTDRFSIPLDTNLLLISVSKNDRACFLGANLLSNE
jgi:hypothetical protein